MTQPIVFSDLSPASRELTPEEAAWLRRLHDSVAASEFVIRASPRRDDDGEEMSIVATDSRGEWRAGRFIGTISFEGRTLEIRPRLGMSVIGEWATQAFNVVAVPRSVTHEQSEAFIAWFLALIWGRAVAQAARHGLPSLKATRHYEGLVVRGRLDVRRTVSARRHGHFAVASTAVERTLANDVNRVLVLAERALTHRLGSDVWMPQRVRDLMPRLWEAVGTRPTLPKKPSLRKIRYTPITRPFAPVVEMSYRLARGRGFVASERSGTADGLLLDVAELWELFLVSAVRRAVAPLRVVHDTRATDPSRYLLTSQSGRRMGRLIPDIVVLDGDRPIAIIDAKYKRLAPSKAIPTGVQRDDLYQLAAYTLGLHTENRLIAALAYPRDDDQQLTAIAEADSPWRSGVGDDVHFMRAPIDMTGCVDVFHQLISPG